MIPIAAEILTHIGPLPITNTYVNSTIMTVIFIVFAFVLNRRLAEQPGKLQNAFESLLNLIFVYFDQVTGNRERSKRFLPIVGTMFLFILCSNWFGLLPGTGTIGIRHGTEFIPFLRSANSDLNLTLAMALISVVGSNLLGMFTLGFFTHWNKFIQFGSLWRAIRTFNLMKIFVGFIEFGVGFIELISEFAKIISLSLRLFGNIFAGEVLITVIASLIGFIAPIPFMFLELIFGIIQATVFAMLTLVYLTVMSAKPHGATHEDEFGAAEADALKHHAMA